MSVGCEIDGCGVQATGRCDPCERAFCASHQAYKQAPYSEVPIPYAALCVVCGSERARKEAELAARVTQVDRAAGQSVVDRHLAIADPIERLIRLVVDLSRVERKHVPDRGMVDLCVVRPPHGPTFRKVFPDLSDPFVNDEPTWDGTAIAAWFAARAEREGIEPPDAFVFPVPAKKRFLRPVPKVHVAGGVYMVPGKDTEPAWCFAGGSTDGRSDAYVTRNGRAWLDGSPHASKVVRVPSSHTFRPVAIHEMARILGFTNR